MALKKSIELPTGITVNHWVVTRLTMGVLDDSLNVSVFAEVCPFVNKAAKNGGKQLVFDAKKTFSLSIPVDSLSKNIFRDVYTLLKNDPFFSGAVEE
jgi:hypothetical protein